MAKTTDPRFVNFPSIYDFHRVIREVREHVSFLGKDGQGKAIYDRAPKMPTVKYRGSVKIHGTNAAIVKRGQRIHCQSRDNVISLEKDHFGLQQHVDDHELDVRMLFAEVGDILELDPAEENVIAFFGEWAGDKIQTLASIAVLPKFFNIVAINVNGVWQNMRRFKNVMHEPARIFNSEFFPTYSVEVDFSRPDLMQTQLAEMTAVVEADCPVAKYFGIKGIGEGIVWNPEEDNDPRYWMKVKGQEHSNTNVRVLNTIDTDEVKRHYNFVDAVVQEPRLRQALHVTQYEMHLEVNEKNMVEFIRWIYADIVREEAILIEERNIDVKKIGRPVSEICKAWYIKHLRSLEAA